MTKQIIALLCLVALCLSVFCACAAEKQTADATTQTAAEESAQPAGEPIDFSGWSEAGCLAFAEERGVYPTTPEDPTWGLFAKRMMTTGLSRGLTMGRPDVFPFEMAIDRMMCDYYQEFGLDWHEHLGVPPMPVGTEQQTEQP